MIGRNKGREKKEKEWERGQERQEGPGRDREGERKKEEREGSKEKKEDRKFYEMTNQRAYLDASRKTFGKESTSIKTSSNPFTGDVIVKNTFYFQDQVQVHGFSK